MHVGQGMNASMNDSHNLGEYISTHFFLLILTIILVWKITQVLRGSADMSLLRTVCISV